MTRSQHHQGCSDSYHDQLIGSDRWWSAGTHSREHRIILGTDRCEVRGACRACGRTLVRGSVPLAVAVAGASAAERAPAHEGSTEFADEPCTVVGYPPPPPPAPPLPPDDEWIDLDWWLDGDTVTDLPVVELDARASSW